jgi:hypothetical protein
LSQLDGTVDLQQSTIKPGSLDFVIVVIKIFHGMLEAKHLGAR